MAPGATGDGLFACPPDEERRPRHEYLRHIEARAAVIAAIGIQEGELPREHPKQGDGFPAHEGRRIG